jgi:hypothetical protein
VTDTATATDTPTGTNTTTGPIETITSDTDDGSTVAETPTLSSQFSFLTETTLLLPTPESTETPEPTTTETDPDVPTTSIPLEGVSQTATITAIPLPTDLPARIFPAEGGVNPSDVPSGYTPVAILFDTALGWEFVAKHSRSSAQIFAYFPSVIQNAVNIPGMWLILTKYFRGDVHLYVLFQQPIKSRRMRCKCMYRRTTFRRMTLASCAPCSSATSQRSRSSPFSCR